MLDKKTQDDLIRFIIESENGFCSTAMSLENIKKCERWIADVAEISKANITIIGKYKTPAEFNDRIRRSVWKEAFNLNSLTPNEAATIYLESQGERDNFDSTQEIFQRKRGEVLPEQFSDNPDESDGRLRAIMLRETVTDRFLQTYAGLGFRYSGKSSELLKTFDANGGSKNDWMHLSRGYDIFETEAQGVPELDENGNEVKDRLGNTVTRPSVHLIAYKTPYGKDGYNQFKREIPLGDVAKFAYQKLGLEEAGIHIDNCSIAALNDAIFTVRKFEVTGVDEIKEDVKQACEEFWSNCIKKGHAPTRERSNNYQDGLQKALEQRDGRSDEAIIRIHEAAYKLAANSMMKNKADKLVDEAKNELVKAALRAGVSLDDVLEMDKKGNLKGKTRLGLVDVGRTGKITLDVDGLKKEYESRSGDLEAIQTEKGDVDPVKLVELSEAMGIEVSSYNNTKYSDRFTVNASKGSEFYPIKTQIEEVIQQTLDDLIEEMGDMITEMYGEKPEVAPPVITEPKPQAESSPKKELSKDMEFGW